MTIATYFSWELLRIDRKIVKNQPLFTKRGIDIPGTPIKNNGKKNLGGLKKLTHRCVG